MKYHVVIGLEIHVQLNTKTKLFCACLNEYNPENPNKNICPFCTGQPGALPQLNKAGVKKAIKLGVAFGSNIPEKTRWDRKNYFYPDSPNGYQISQYDNPIVEGGKLEFYFEENDGDGFKKSHVVLERAHLEADAAKMTHKGSKSLIDFNRCCAPLVEIVTTPCIKSAKQAMAFVNELQLLVRTIGISEADMDKGMMRFDCNLSLQNDEQFKKGELPPYRVETKNINSTRSLGRAIEYEIKRQAGLLDKGITPDQETRGWRDDKNKSITQRSKEDANDYRYFPEPDLKILEIKRSEIPSIEELPDLPNVKREKYMNEYGFNYSLASTFVNQEDVGKFFEDVIDQI